MGVWGMNFIEYAGAFLPGHVLTESDMPGPFYRSMDAGKGRP